MVQVLQRQADPNASAYQDFVTQQQKQQEMLVDARYKAGQLRTWAEQNKINAMAQQDESAALKLKQDSARATKIADVIDRAAGMKDMSPDEKQKAIMTYSMQLGLGELFKEYPDLAKIGASPQAQKDTAQAGKLVQEGRQAGSVADLIQSKLGGGQPQQQQQPVPQQPPENEGRNQVYRGGELLGTEGSIPNYKRTVDGIPADNQGNVLPDNRAAALSGGQPTQQAPSGSGPLIPSMNVGGVQIDFPEDKAASAARVRTATTKAANIEELKKSAAPAAALIDSLEAKWKEAFPNMPEKGLGVLLSGIENTRKSLYRQDPKIRSYLTTREAFLSLLTRGLGEKGVLTNVDIQRVAKAIPGQATGAETAKLNFGTVRQIITGAVGAYLSSGGDPAVVAAGMRQVKAGMSGDTQSEYERYKQAIGAR